MRRLLPVTCLAIALGGTGCVVVPYPMAKRVESRAPSHEAVDFSFVQPGTTKRAEVEEKLKMIDAGVRIPGLFWGRFATSSYGAVGAAAMPYGGGGVGGGRGWSEKNLWIEFDDQETVKVIRIVPESEIKSEFARWFQGHNHVSHLPMAIEGAYWHRRERKVHLAIQENQIEFREEEDACEASQKNECPPHILAPASLVAIHTEALPAKHGDDRYNTWLKIDTANKKRTLKLQTPLTAEQVVEIVAYMSKNCPNAKYR